VKQIFGRFYGKKRHETRISYRVIEKGISTGGNSLKTKKKMGGTILLLIGELYEMEGKR